MTKVQFSRWHPFDSLHRLVTLMRTRPAPEARSRGRLLSSILVLALVRRPRSRPRELQSEPIEDEGRGSPIGGSGSRPTGRAGARPSIFAAVFLLFGLSAHAQELEPRAYSNLPIGLHFAVVAYAYSEGGLATDPSLPLEDAHLRIHTSVLAFSHSLDLKGSSGRFDLILPISDLSGTAMFLGEQASRDISGLGDPRFRLAVNFRGAPAGDLKAFAQYMAKPPRTVLGASLQVIPPLGQYDPARLINLGTNRWTFKPDIGFSRRIKSFTWDMTFGAAFATDNDDFFGGKHVEQDPLYSTQLNLSYDFGKGIWAALGTTYYVGGQTTVDGVEKDNELGNTRVGLTVAFPFNRNYSVKFNVSTGVSTRTGTNFDTYGLALQYRWGGGL